MRQRHKTTEEFSLRYPAGGKNNNDKLRHRKAGENDTVFEHPRPQCFVVSGRLEGALRLTDGNASKTAADWKYACAMSKSGRGADVENRAACKRPASSIPHAAVLTGTGGGTMLQQDGCLVPLPEQRRNLTTLRTVLRGRKTEKASTGLFPFNNLLITTRGFHG